MYIIYVDIKYVRGCQANYVVVMIRMEGEEEEPVNLCIKRGYVDEKKRLLFAL